ncbi:GGDEF domain-containing protein [Colwelliaceae bacterium 6441]
MIDFKAMKNQLYREPWQTLQQLMTLAPQVELMTTDKKLWWHIRKAQCENLLYLYDDFVQTLAKLTTIIDKNASLTQQANFYYLQGVSSQTSGNYIQSRQQLKKAMEIAKQAQLTRLYIEAKRELAYSYSLVDLFEASLTDLQEAYVEAFALNDRFLLATINETYGAIYGYMRQNEKSIEYYQKALETYESLGFKSHASEAIYGIASTYRYWKKYQLAVQYFKLYQQKVSYTPNTNISYFGAYGMGMTYAEQGKCTEALTIIEEAFQLSGLDDYDAELYKRKASCLITFNQLDEAEEALNASDKIFSSMPELIGTVWQLELLKIHAALEKAKGNYLKAYQFLEEYYQKYAEILIENSSSRVVNLRANMEMKHQEMEKALSSERSKADLLEQQNQNQKTLQQRYFIIFLLILLVIVIAIVTLQFRSNRKMALLTITDSMSGLFNRRYIFKCLKKSIENTPPEKGQLAILVLDIDDFKIINDTYGHPMGDHVIKIVAKLAQQALRSEDMIGRIGGEEFLCILPRSDLAITEKIAQRMKTKISEHVFSFTDGSEFSVTVSIGASCLTSQVREAKALYSLADQALYQAKKLGKNCVKAISSP